MLASTLKPTVSSLPKVAEPNGSSAPPSLPIMKFHKTTLPPLQLTGNGKQETTATAVSRRELLGLAATTLGGLALFAAKPAEAVEAADIGSSIKELLRFFNGKPKTGADNEKKPKSEADEKKLKVENHGNKPKTEDEKKSKNGDDKKSLTPHHMEKDKVPSSSAAPTLPNTLNNTAS
ncbi:hypothetical protein P3S67_030586 [Capsicum chacoense]